MLITKRLAIIVTLKCTLNCRLCCNCVPLYKEKPLIPKESILQDIAGVFQIYDKIEWLQFVGGELFLHPDMGDILHECLKYGMRFDKVILMTNGTVLPGQAALHEMKSLRGKIQVQISDYGSLSVKARELEALLKENEIDYVTKPFYGDIQHYGGWVDCGGFEDRRYSQELLEETFGNCWQIHLGNLHAYNGRLHNCIRSLFGQDLGYIQVPQDEFIDLKSQELTLEEKRKIAGNFGKKPLEACRYCSGFDTKNAVRHPAAEQQ